MLNHKGVPALQDCPYIVADILEYLKQLEKRVALQELEIIKLQGAIGDEKLNKKVVTS